MAVGAVAASNPATYQADLDADFRSLQARESLKFSYCYLGASAIYIAIYFWLAESSTDGNLLPPSCVGINVFFIMCAIGCHYNKHLTRFPIIVHGVGLVVMSMLAGIANPEVQFYLSHYTTLLEPFGEPPNCTGTLKRVYNKIPGNRCYMNGAYFSTMLMQLSMTYYVIFLLRLRIAIMMGVPSFLIYIAWSVTCGSVLFAPERGLEFALFAFSMVIVFLAKYTMETSQYRLFMEVDAQRMKVVHEKVLRCQAEFRNETLQVVLTKNVQEDNVIPSNKSEGTMSSAGVFTGIGDDSDTAETLQRICAIGSKEHWLLDNSSIRIFPQQLLGGGGFGWVIKGDYGCTSVALKLSIESGREKHWSKNLNTLANELRILRRLRHPNVVLFYGACIDFSSHQLVLVLELVAGETLTIWITNSNKTEDVKALVLLDVSSALSYLHGQIPCVVHGDIKDSNIMIERLADQPRAKLLDFGLSRILTSNAKRLGGTWRWMAPEVARGQSRPTSASDVFSFGRLIYFIATEKMPFADYSEKVVRRILKKSSSTVFVWPSVGTSFSARCRSVGEACMSVMQHSRPRMPAVHGDILGWNLLPAGARYVFEGGNRCDSISLSDFLEHFQVPKQSTWQNQVPKQSSVSNCKCQSSCKCHCKVAVVGSSSCAANEQSGKLFALPRVPEDPDVVVHVSELNRFKPTPQHRKLESLGQVMASWYNAPSNSTCCTWHHSLRDLEQIVALMEKRSAKCAHGCEVAPDAYQCPRCLLVLDPVDGVCSFCDCPVGGDAIPPSDALQLCAVESQLALPVVNRYSL